MPQKSIRIRQVSGNRDFYTPGRPILSLLNMILQVWAGPDKVAIVRATIGLIPVKVANCCVGTLDHNPERIIPVVSVKRAGVTKPIRPIILSSLRNYPYGGLMIGT